VFTTNNLNLDPSFILSTMKWLYPLALVTTFAGMVYTEVLDFGDLKQYDPKIVIKSQPAIFTAERNTWTNWMT